MIPVVVRYRAEADLEKAKARYAREDERLGFRFSQEFSVTVDRIAALPDQFPEVGNGYDVRCCTIFHTPRISFVARTSPLSSRFFTNISDPAVGSLG